MAATKDKTVMRISYNAPVTLTFTLLCLAVTILGMVGVTAIVDDRRAGQTGAAI